MEKEAVKELTREKFNVPKRYKVLIYNDDYTTMEFVVDILVDIFEKTEEEAEKLMLDVHFGCSAVVGIYTKYIANTKVGKATELARREGFPLKLEAVEE